MQAELFCCWFYCWHLAGCILGDEIDGVPGIQHLVPGFGRKTALKLLKKHGSLENLLSAASVRSVGKQYAQEALTKYADFLRKNYEVLSLKRSLLFPISFCFRLLHQEPYISCSSFFNIQRCKCPYWGAVAGHKRCQKRFSYLIQFYGLPE